MTKEELKQKAILIRDEKTENANTANRVGAALLDIINDSVETLDVSPGSSVLDAPVKQIVKNGIKIAPETNSDAVKMKEMNVPMSRMVTDINVSELFPAGGVGGSDKYELGTAVAKIPAAYRHVGVKCSYVDYATNGLLTYIYQGGEYLDVSSWIRYDGIDTNAIAGVSYDALSEMQRCNGFIESDSDLDIIDEAGYVIASFAGGHVRTKHFDSSQKDEIVSHFAPGDFRAYIPVCQNGGRFYTNYDFEGGRIKGHVTCYLDPNGNDANSGLSPNSAKKTIESCLALVPSTIVFAAGIYVAGTHFANALELKNLNLIGIGDVTVDANAGKPIRITGSMFVKNISFVNGNLGSLNTFITDINSKCTYINCSFCQSIADNADVGVAQSLGGLRVQGGTHFIYKCEASNNWFDGFNYHAAEGAGSGQATSVHVVEVECSGYRNGIDNNYESNNGSSAHDACKILRVNCEYGCNHGGNIADVHANTVSYNIGCTAFSCVELPPGKESYQANFYAEASSEMHLTGCRSSGSRYDISCQSGGIVYTDNRFDNNFTNNGTINKK